MRLAHPALALLGALASAAGAAGVDDGNVNSTAIPGSYIVEFEGDDGIKAFYDGLEAEGIEVDRRMDLNYRLFKGASFSLRNLTDAEATADRIGALSRVKSLWPVRKVQFPRPAIVSVGVGSTAAHAARLQTRQETAQNLFTPHLMTQVSKLHEKGVTGKGVRIGIIDTGVDYLHPALGGCFGEGCLVSYGYDLNGDDNTSPVPVPDADPMNNCDPHGTHVAGIIAAQPNELGFTGAAPGATIGMYKVAGCGGTTTNEMIAAAMNMAYEAGSDIISMSAGDDSGWSSDPWAVSASRIAAAGTPLIIANGNSGDLGLWYPATPASGREVTAVGSVENTIVPMILERGLYAVNNGTTSAFGIMNRGNPPFSRNVTLPLWAVSNSTESIDDACQALPADTPNLSDKVVLVREAGASGCTPTTQATNIAAMGGRYILWYSSKENSITNVYVYLDVIEGVAQATAAQGAQWIAAINQGETVTVAISASGSAGVFVQEWKAPASGGYTSGMSTWGPTWEVDVKPQFTAPGGNILSTYPVSQGSYAVLSGTSMATPMVAGIFALLGEARGTLDVKLLRRVLSATAKPKAWFDGTAAHGDMLASVAQQGAGLVQAYDAALTKTILSVSSLSFNDSDNFVANRTFSIQNTAPVDISYTLGHAQAVTVYSLAEAADGILGTPTEHGVMPSDLTPVLMQNARVKNPMAEEKEPSLPSTPKAGAKSSRSSVSTRTGEESPAMPPPPYESHVSEEMPDVKTPSQLPSSQKIDIDLRWTVLCDLFLVLIVDSVYDARSRVLLERMGKTLEVPWLDICRFEKRVTDALEMQQQAEQENWNEDEHLENRRKMALKRKYVMMGLATVGGGLVIGLSAGLAAPLIGAGLAAGFTTIGVGGTSSFLAGAGGAAIITSGAAASGSYMGGKAANKRMGAVRTFEYRPLHNNKRVNLIVTISGWMTSTNDDVRLPFSTVDPIMGDIYSILWEPEMLTSMGDTINILATEALTQGLQQVLGSTILMGLMAALQLPVVLSKLAYLIDNPWSVSMDRAWSAGLILADSLIDRSLGARPITLVGYSLGSRVIFSCLLELARKGAFGLVQNAYLFGSPLVIKQEEYLRCRTVVSGRFVNGYNKNDWILGYLFRLTNGGIRRVAGLATIDGIPGIENMDCSEFVVGHMDYRQAMPKLLRECGWMVESDEFTEIEDPDPDQHRERQRELISEIEEARQQLEKDGAAEKKGAFAFFSRKKKQKQDWEIYEDSNKAPGPNGQKTEDKFGNNHGVLFDVDAMRAELAKEAEDAKDADNPQARQLTSALPPIQINSSPNSPRHNLRETQSEYSTTTMRSVSSPGLGSSQERTPTLGSGRFDYSTPRPSPSFVPYGHAEEEEVQMTFDTAFADDNKPPAPPAKDDMPPSRPDYKSSQTVPNMTVHDPWADDDDDDFGKEKEISMTFA